MYRVGLSGLVAVACANSDGSGAPSADPAPIAQGSAPSQAAPPTSDPEPSPQPSAGEPPPGAAAPDDATASVAPPAEPDAAPDPTPATTACLEALPSLPAALPDEGRRCLEGLAAARTRFGFASPPAPDATPCAVEERLDDGTLYASGPVKEFSPKTQVAVFDRPEEYDQRTVRTRTVKRDAKGREVFREVLWDLYLENETTPDCSNPTTTRHTLDGRGWPKKSKKVIDTCEGVDAGTISTNRSFTKHAGAVTAKLKIVDRGTKLEGTAWWLPDPAAPLAGGETDHYGDVDCWLEVRDCDGAVLGRMRGREEGQVREVELHVWTCPAAEPEKP